MNLIRQGLEDGYELRPLGGNTNNNHHAPHSVAHIRHADYPAHVQLNAEGDVLNGSWVHEDVAVTDKYVWDAATNGYVRVEQTVTHDIHTDHYRAETRSAYVGFYGLLALLLAASLAVMIVLLLQDNTKKTIVDDGSIAPVCGTPSVPMSGYHNVTPLACNATSDCSRPNCTQLGYRYGFHIGDLEPGTYTLCFTSDGTANGMPPPPPPPPVGGSSGTPSASSGVSSESVGVSAFSSDPDSSESLVAGADTGPLSWELTAPNPVEDPRACVTFTVAEDGRTTNWTGTITMDAVLVTGDTCTTNVYAYNTEESNDTLLGAPPPSVFNPPPELPYCDELGEAEFPSFSSSGSSGSGYYSFGDAGVEATTNNAAAATTTGGVSVASQPCRTRPPVIDQNSSGSTTSTSGSVNGCGTQNFMGEMLVSGTTATGSQNTMAMSYTYTSAGGIVDQICVYIANRDPNTSNRGFSVSLYTGSYWGGPGTRLTHGSGTVVTSSTFHCVDVPNVYLTPTTGYWFGYNTNAGGSNYNNPYYTSENDGSARPPYRVGYASRTYSNGWPSTFGSFASSYENYEILIYAKFVACTTTTTSVASTTSASTMAVTTSGASTTKAASTQAVTTSTASTSTTRATTSASSTTSTTARVTTTNAASTSAASTTTASSHATTSTASTSAAVTTSAAASTSAASTTAQSTTAATTTAASTAAASTSVASTSRATTSAASTTAASSTAVASTLAAATTTNAASVSASTTNAATTTQAASTTSVASTTGASTTQAAATTSQAASTTAQATTAATVVASTVAASTSTVAATTSAAASTTAVVTTTAEASTAASDAASTTTLATQTTSIAVTSTAAATTSLAATTTGQASTTVAQTTSVAASTASTNAASTSLAASTTAAASTSVAASTSAAASTNALTTTGAATTTTTNAASTNALSTTAASTAAVASTTNSASTTSVASTAAASTTNAVTSTAAVSTESASTSAASTSAATTAAASTTASTSEAVVATSTALASTTASASTTARATTTAALSSAISTTAAASTAATTGISTTPPPPTSCVVGCDGVCNSGATFDQCGLCVTPNPDNVTFIVLTGVIRDFNGTRTRGGHPDFEYTIGDDRNITTLAIGSDKKPVYGNHPSGTLTTHNAVRFNQWWNNSPGVNLAMPFSITLHRLPSGVFSYTNFSFFPIDDQLFGNQGRAHNFHFTYEIHLRFTYRGGEVFNFLGDDDVWVYINGHRVIDIGGVHIAQNATVSLDDVASTVGISIGNDYDFDFFYAERHTTMADLQIETSILLYTCTCLDVCGVCGGDNSSCVGCDGVPNSGKTYDSCGVCGGDNSTCTGVLPPITDIEFCYDYELRVNKTAQGLFDKLVQWAIEKHANPENITALAGQVANTTYTVTLVKHEADAQYRVVGTVTVENPSPLQINVTVTDTVSPSQPEADTFINCPNNGVIAPYASIECHYAVLNLTDTDVFLNVALVTASDGVGHGTATAPVVFDYSGLVVGDPDTLFLEDQVDGESAVFLGTFSDSIEFNYTTGYVCPIDQNEYDEDGLVEFTIVNHITDLNDTDVTANSTVTLGCRLSIVVILSKQFVCGREHLGQIPFTFALRNDDLDETLESINVTGDTNVTFSVVINEPGNYVVVEETPVPTGWIVMPESQRCEFTVDDTLNIGREVLCAFVNIEQGRVEIRQHIEPNDSIATPEDLPWIFELYEGLATQGSGSLLWSGESGDGTDFGGMLLSPLETYTICQRYFGAGWSSTWTSSTTYEDLDNSGTLDDPYEVNHPDPTGYWTDTVVPYNLNRTDSNQPSSVGILCYSIVPGESPITFSVKPGRTTVIDIVNTPPVDTTGTGAVSQRSTPFWLDWNSCNTNSTTQQEAYAYYVSTGGPSNDYFILDDVLSGPYAGQIIWDDNQVNDTMEFIISNCTTAVAVLQMRDQVSGALRNHDAGYILARTLLAAQLNFGVGAYACSNATQAAFLAEQALDAINFDGVGAFLPPATIHTGMRAYALSLATKLEKYSDGILCKL